MELCIPVCGLCLLFQWWLYFFLFSFVCSFTSWSGKWEWKKKILLIIHFFALSLVFYSVSLSVLVSFHFLWPLKGTMDRWMVRVRSDWRKNVRPLDLLHTHTQKIYAFTAFVQIAVGKFSTFWYFPNLRDWKWSYYPLLCVSWRQSKIHSVVIKIVEWVREREREKRGFGRPKAGL